MLIWRSFWKGGGLKGNEVGKSKGEGLASKQTVRYWSCLLRILPPGCHVNSKISMEQINVKKLLCTRSSIHVDIQRMDASTLKVEACPSNTSPLLLSKNISCTSKQTAAIISLKLNPRVPWLPPISSRPVHLSGCLPLAAEPGCRVAACSSAGAVPTVPHGTFGKSL